jgi:hypothetical protein
MNSENGTEASKASDEEPSICGQASRRQLFNQELAQEWHWQ